MIWLTVFIFNHMITTIGPLPYGTPQCQQMRTEYSLSLDDNFSDGKTHGVIDGKPVSRADVTIRCIRRPTRPEEPIRLYRPFHGALYQ